jgi:matrixin
MRTRIGLALLLPALGQAYTVWSSNNTAPLNIIKWPAMPVDVEIHDAGTTSPDAPNAVTAIQTAFGTWQAVTGAGVQFNVGSWSGAYLDYGSDSGNGLNRTGFVLSGWPPSLSSALAITLVQGVGPVGSEYIDEADIYFNEDMYDWSTSGDPSLFDVQSVATHEIGHLIGLDHTPIVVATMYYATGPGDTSQQSLHPDDEEGARFLYPAPPPHTCVVNGDCPTVLDFADKASFGSMVCVAGSPNDCCLGTVCGSGTGGSLGDPCQQDMDCAPGLECPYNGDTCQQCDPSSGGTFPPCPNQSACTGSDTCYYIGSDATCGLCLPPCSFQIDCFPDIAHCIDANGAGDQRCIPDEVTGYYRCQTFEPSQCPTGHGCLRGVRIGTTILGSICWPRGTVDFGGACTDDTDCLSLLCYNPSQTPNGGVCAQACGTDWPSCPTGYSCELSGYFTIEVCQSWGAEPVPDLGPPEMEAAPEPAPEPAVEPVVDAAPDAPAFEPPPDEGCQCATGARPAGTAEVLAGLVLCLSVRRRRKAKTLHRGPARYRDSIR